MKMIRPLAVIIVVASLFSFVGISILPTAKADIYVQAPTASDGVIVSYQSAPPHGGYRYVIQSDSYAIRNPFFDQATCSFEFSHTAFLMNWGFTIENIYSINMPPNDPLNITITELKIVLGTVIEPQNAGYFSFCIDYPTSDDPPVTFAKQYGNWTDSPLYPYYDALEYPYYFGAAIYWNITSYRNWSVSDLLSPYSFRVMWTFTNNETVQKFDYLGIEYYFTYPETVVETPSGIPFTFSVVSLIWLLIIYLPAIAMAQVIPKIGFSMGMVLMLIVVASTQANFFPIALLGICSIGIFMYKDSG